MMRAHSWVTRPTPRQLQHDTPLVDVSYRHLSKGRVKLTVRGALRARQVVAALEFAPTSVSWKASTERHVDGRRRTTFTAWPAPAALEALRVASIQTAFVATPALVAHTKEAA